MRWLAVRGRWLVAVAVLLVGAGGAVLGLFVFPSTGALRPADAVVVLAGDAPARLPLAVALAEGGPAVLVVSVAEGEDNESARALCVEPRELTVRCFRADGSDTRAEARALGRLVAEEGWTRITVVTSSYHVVRAGLLVRRCTDAEVQVVDPPARMSLRRWAHAVVGEVGGLVVASVDRSC
ncbi:YdcF family protein [Geodermatophilus sp. SYSU D01106]